MGVRQVDKELFACGLGASSGRVVFEVAQWFSDRGGGGLGDDLVVVGDGPGAIEMLTDIDLGFGVGASSRSGWDVDGEPSEAHGVVVEHGGLVAEL